MIENTIAENDIATLAISELQPILKGKILADGNDGYDTERKVWNGMIDRRPAVIAQCLTSNDVVQSVKFAKDNNLVISVRGGGHNVTGNAVCDKGIMIDLSLRRTVNVDTERRHC